MNSFKPSKTLNIKSNFFGLTLDDLLGLMIFYSVFQLVFSLIGFELLSIILTFCLSLFLIPIRLRLRRGIIKDYFVFSFHRILKGNLL